MTTDTTDMTVATGTPRLTTARVTIAAENEQRGMPPARARPAGLASLGPGLLVAGAVAVAGVLLAALEERLLGHALLEGLVLALLLGVLVRNLLPRPERYAAGASFAAKQVLEAAVALLGISVDARALFAAGPALLGLVVSGVTLSIGVSFSIGRLLGLSPHLAALVAAGNSICGNSAIAAVAPAIRAEKKDVASAIALTAVLGLVVVLLLPLTIPLVGLSHYQYGVLAGMSVYAVPQVLAATFPVSQLSGEVGTLVKLLRVLLLGPAVVVLGVLFRGYNARRTAASAGITSTSHTTGALRGTNARWSAYVPWFVAAFLGLAALRSAGVVPTVVAMPAKQASTWLTVLAMAGLGMGVELAAVRRVGLRVGAAVFCSLVALIAGVTIAILALRIGG